MTPEAAKSFLKLSSVLFRAFLAVSVLALGAAIAMALVRTKPTPPVRTPDPVSLTVGTVPAKRLDIPRQWTGYGTARSMQAIDISAQVAARVIERPASLEAGTAVSTGDLLVRLEQTDYLARARAAEQLVAQAFADLAALDIDETSWREQLALANEQAEIERRELKQALGALERGAGTASEIDRRAKSLRILEVQVSTIQQKINRLPIERQSLQATLDRLRADADLANEQLNRTTIVSPISGVVQRVDVEQGEVVSVGDPIARVVDLSRLEVPLRTPASALGYVRVGDEVDLRPDAPSTKRWPGTVARIAPEADQATRTLTVFVEVRQDARAFQNAGEGDTLLLPGEFVMGTITGAPEHGRTVVPRSAVREGAVFIAEPNDQQAWTTRRVTVEVLFRTNGAFPEIDTIERQWAVLDTTIPEGSLIIVTNIDDLSEGRFVNQRLRATAGGSQP